MLHGIRCLFWSIGMHVEKHHTVGAIGVGLIGLAALGSGWVSTSRPQPSELSADRTIAVISSRDSGPGTLREAIFAAARSPERIRIEIRPRRIELFSPLPAIVNPRGVVLDAERSGSRINAREVGAVPVLDVAAPNSVIAGLAIDHCGAQGIQVRARGALLKNVEVVDCAEGVRLAVSSAGAIVEDSRFRQNGTGIVLADAFDATIRRNKFSGQDQAGIWVVSEDARERTSTVQILSNEFESDRIGVVAINVPVLIQRNEFRRERESALHLMGRGAVVRQNRVRDGNSIGIFADATDGIIVEGNEVDRNGVGMLLRSSRNSLTRENRIHSNAYGVAVVFGDAGSSNLLAENLITSQTYDGFYVVGASPLLRRNVVVRNQKAALRILDFVPLKGATVAAVPLLRANRFEANLMDQPVKGLYLEPEVQE
jgi:parallel beta-helix repeat protein